VTRTSSFMTSGIISGIFFLVAHILEAATFVVRSLGHICESLEEVCDTRVGQVLFYGLVACGIKIYFS
jgi:hypothetical protein